MPPADFTMPTATATAAEIIINFGNHIKTIHRIDTALDGPLKGNLSSDEVSIVYRRLLARESNLNTALKEKLSLSMEVFYAFRYQTMSLLHVLDAMIDEKSHHDTVGSDPGTYEHEFKEAFVLCADLIPERVNIGLLGAFRGLPGINNYPDAPSPAAQDQDYDEFDDADYPEVYALAKYEGGPDPQKLSADAMAPNHGDTLFGLEDHSEDEPSEEYALTQYERDTDGMSQYNDDLPDYSDDDADVDETFMEVPGSSDSGESQNDVISISSDDTYSPLPAQSASQDGGQTPSQDPLWQAFTRVEEWHSRLMSLEPEFVSVSSVPENTLARKRSSQDDQTGIQVKRVCR